MPILQPGQTSIELPTDRDGVLSYYAWPGGYPLFYVAHEEYSRYAFYVICAKCANSKREREHRGRIVGYDINWQDPNLYCEVCNQRVESAYTEDEAQQCDTL